MGHRFLDIIARKRESLALILDREGGRVSIDGSLIKAQAINVNSGD